MFGDESIASADLGPSVAKGGDLDFMALKIGIQNNLNIYNLKDGIVDRYNDASGVDASASTNETRDSSGKYYSGYSLVPTTEDYHPNLDGVANWYDTPGSVSGTNNILFTSGSINSGGAAVMNDQSGKIAGVFTLITEITQMAGGAAPHSYGFGVSKNTDVLDSYTGNTVSAFPTTTMKNLAVGNKIKVVYDTDNENVITHYVDTGSGYGSAITTVYNKGANFDSTTLVTPYFFLVNWSDNSTPWKFNCTGTRLYDAISYNNMTLISTAQTAQAAPTTGRIMVLDEASTGTTTINSDIKAYISRDNGTTYSQATLTDDGEYATGKRMLSGSVDISGQPSGTAMRYKIETLNQSASKVTRIYGTALMW